MKRILREEAREVWLEHLVPPYLLTDSLSGDPFTALVVFDGRSSISQRASTARSLVAWGCRRVVLVAADAAAWKVEIDHASASRFPGFTVPEGEAVEVETFAPAQLRAGALACVADSPGRAAGPTRVLAVRCSPDLAAGAELERVLTEVVRGDPLPHVWQGGGHASVPESGRRDEKSFVSEAASYGAVGHRFDAYGRESACEYDVEVVHRADRWLQRCLFGDLPVRIEMKPLKRGSVAIAWRAQHPRLGRLEGSMAIVDDVTLSTFSSDDGQHHGVECYRWTGPGRFELVGSLFGGPILISSWRVELARCMPASAGDGAMPLRRSPRL